MNKKVLIAMSGGVDSSVAALLLRRQGYTCIGCTMKLYENETAGISKAHTCCSLSDVEDARSVACRLSIPYYVFNYSEAFYEKVVRKFAAEYLCGRTPNPCIDCNRYMKFGLLYEKAKTLDCDYVATGHYASITENDGVFSLKKAKDASKDQSYVLYPLSQQALSHTLFPLGGLSKSEVRKIAQEIGFLNADKPDSQDICFVPDGDYAGVVTRVSGKKPICGEFVSQDGTVLGRHKGIIHYTVGQRKGLGLSAGRPLYVCGIDAQTQKVVLGGNESLLRDRFSVREINRIGTALWQEPFRCSVKIRYKSDEVSCTVCPTGIDTATVILDHPVRAVTPGQAAVFYQADEVLGGGIIE